jgi:hypothetical protein
VVNIYDFLIFPTIWLENLFFGSKGKKKETYDGPGKVDVFDEDDLITEKIE